MNNTIVIQNTSISIFEIGYYFGVDKTLFIGRKNKYALSFTYEDERSLSSALESLDTFMTGKVITIGGYRLNGVLIQNFDKLSESGFYLRVEFFTIKKIYIQFESEESLNDAAIDLTNFLNIVSLLPPLPSKTKFVSPAFAGQASPYFSTIGDATQAAESGDTILVYPGNYTETSIVAKDNVSIECYEGVTIGSENDNIFSDDNAKTIFRITGFPKIISNSRVFYIQSSESVFNVEVDLISRDVYNDNPAIHILDGQFNCKLNSSFDSVYGIGIKVEGGKNIFDIQNLNCLTDFSGGTTNLNCVEIITPVGTAAALYAHSTSKLDIVCNSINGSMVFSGDSVTRIKANSIVGNASTDFIATDSKAILYVNADSIGINNDQKINSKGGSMVYLETTNMFARMRATGASKLNVIAQTIYSTLERNDPVYSPIVKIACGLWYNANPANESINIAGGIIDIFADRLIGVTTINAGTEVESKITFHNTTIETTEECINMEANTKCILKNCILFSTNVAVIVQGHGLHTGLYLYSCLANSHTDGAGVVSDLIVNAAIII